MEIHNYERDDRAMNVLCDQDDDNLSTIDDINIGIVNNNNLKSRKRIKNELEWKRNVRKIKKNSGQPYVNVKGRHFDKKQLQPPCNDTCKFKCTSHFTNDNREQVLNAFWKMADLLKQRAYIVKCTTIIQPKYKYQNENLSRLSNSSFFLPVDDTNIRVCKKIFMATLNIGDRFIRTALKKGGRTTNFIEGDLRGKHDNKKKLDPELINKICEHINSFPRTESHYLRSKTSREFIDGTLTIAEMWRLFVAKCQDNNIPSCKFSTYSYIFNTKFNIGFHIPKKDQCGTCEKFNNSNEIEKLEQENNLFIHRHEIELSRAEKNND